MADPDSRPKPVNKWTTNKTVRPGEGTAKPAIKPKLLVPGEGTSAKFIKPGGRDTTGAKKAFPYETISAREKREAREDEAKGELHRKMMMRDSVVDTEERHKMWKIQKRIKKMGIMI